MIATIVERQKAYFNSNVTKSYAFRMSQLDQLYQTIKAYEEPLHEAFSQDLNKSQFEVYETEIGNTLLSIRDTEKNLKRWMRPERVKKPIFLADSKSYIISEPYGVMTIIGPFNYPFQLVMEPLIGAIAAGNTAIIKPSELTPNVTRVIKNMLNENFETDYIEVIEGGISETTELLAQRVDYIFFTGSPTVGKIVMEAASRHLTPVTLELGGKSPVIITQSADLALAAKQIAWGKFLNTGQTCVAPDYVLVDHKIKDEFMRLIIQQIRHFYGEEPEKSPDYGRLATQRHTERLANLIQQTKGTILTGGVVNKNQRYVAPTIVDQVSWSDELMQEEIFGPILPVITYDAENFQDEVIGAIKKHEKPLALYLFTETEALKKSILSQISFGGGVINGTIIHLINGHLPFGGVGQSGIGNYHGKHSFAQFSHKKAIVEKGKLIKLDVLHPPYGVKRITWLKRLMH